tara:strand:+ start:40814 stop:40933 length:120 start_codon:yes stop_codon:yes gene_type:complete
MSKTLNLSVSTISKALKDILKKNKISESEGILDIQEKLF